MLKLFVHRLISYTFLIFIFIYFNWLIAYACPRNDDRQEDAAGGIRLRTG